MNDRKNISRSKKRIIIAVLSIILLVCIAVIVTYYYKQYKARQEYDSLKETTVSQEEESKGSIEKPPIKENEEKNVEIPVDFEELWKTNPDIYAWIEIPDTEINYPILQSVNDPEDYYLDHTVDRISGLPGSIYTRMDNAKDFSDTNTVIYGHNMKNGTMFKGLHKYEDAEYWTEHPYVYIYTPEHILTYEIFAAVTYSDELILSKYDFTTDQGLLDFVDSLKESRGMTDHWKDDVEILPQDKLITMSTCIANRPTNRFIVVAVLRSEE